MRNSPRSGEVQCNRRNRTCAANTRENGRISARRCGAARLDAFVAARHTRVSPSRRSVGYALGAKRGWRAARSTANGRASARSAPKRPRSGGRSNVARRLASGIGALGRRHAPQGPRGALGACDAAVSRRPKLAPRRVRGRSKVTAHSLKIMNFVTAGSPVSVLSVRVRCVGPGTGRKTFIRALWAMSSAKCAGYSPCF